MAMATAKRKRSAKAPASGIMLPPRTNLDFNNFFQIDLTPQRAKSVLAAW
jgi:hypothetical protein